MAKEEAAAAEEATEEDRLTEALAQVNELKAELNEVNILNSKLLYSNKIFKVLYFLFSSKNS